jgi:hypothetical protein
LEKINTQPVIRSLGPGNYVSELWEKPKYETRRMFISGGDISVDNIEFKFGIEVGQYTGKED